MSGDRLGRTTSAWNVEIADEEGRLSASSRVTLAIRPARYRNP